jgi:negative regulator of replication initiation
MAKFTTKKKLTAIGEAMRNVHVLARAIKLESGLIKENIHLIADKEDARSFKEMSRSLNFFISRMDMLYRTDERSNKFLIETKGESAIDELSLRILDALPPLIETFTSSDTKPN